MIGVVELSYAIVHILVGVANSVLSAIVVDDAVAVVIDISIDDFVVVIDVEFVACPHCIRLVTSFLVVFVVSIVSFANIVSRSSICCRQRLEGDHKLCSGLTHTLASFLTSSNKISESV